MRKMSAVLRSASLQTSLLSTFVFVCLSSGCGDTNGEMEADGGSDAESDSDPDGDRMPQGLVPIDGGEVPLSLSRAMCAPSPDLICVAGRRVSCFNGDEWIEQVSEGNGIFRAIDVGVYTTEQYTIVSYALISDNVYGRSEYATGPP